jgi:hypothetical protein
MVATGHAEVTGYVIGPFLVHLAPKISRLKWSLTHIRTKRTVTQNIPTRKRCEWLARKLVALGCWDFEIPDQAKSLTKDVITAIKVLKADARFGDCQGEIR